MRNYRITLKGTKKRNTTDLTVTIQSDNKSQAFNFLYQFFELGETNVVYGSKERGFATIHKWLINADELKQFGGKYKVPKSALICL